MWWFIEPKSKEAQQRRIFIEEEGIVKKVGAWKTNYLGIALKAENKLQTNKNGPDDLSKNGNFEEETEAKVKVREASNFETLEWKFFLWADIWSDPFTRYDMRLPSTVEYFAEPHFSWNGNSSNWDRSRRTEIKCTKLIRNYLTKI